MNTMDTLSIVKTFKKLGINEEESYELAETINNHGNLATKEDLANVKSELKQDIIEIKTELKYLKIVSSGVFIILVAQFVKSFFI